MRLVGTKCANLGIHPWIQVICIRSADRYADSFLFFYKQVTNIQKSRIEELLCRSVLTCELANKLTAHCTKLIYRIFLFLFFLFGGYGHAFLIKGSGCDVIAKEATGKSDLLHEIDKALRIGRGFLLGQGAFAILLNH